jgi:hypothetical protein
MKLNEKQTNELIGAIQDIAHAMNYGPQTSINTSASGWNIADCLEGIYYEFKRYNDRQEGK